MMPLTLRLWVVLDTLVGGGAYAQNGVFVVEGTGPASRVLSVLGPLGGGVYACVFGLLARALCQVEGGRREGGVMEGGMREDSPCGPCVQGGPGVFLHLYGLPLVVSAAGDEDVPGRHFEHLGGVGEVAFDSDLGGVVLAGGCVWEHVARRPLVLRGFSSRVWFEWGVVRFWRRGVNLSFRVGR